MKKRFVSALLGLLILMSIVTIHSFASEATAFNALDNNVNYHAWSQDQMPWGKECLGFNPDYATFNEAGCFVTALSKICVQSGLYTQDEINPFIMNGYLKENKYLNSAGGYTSLRNIGDLLGFTYSSASYSSIISELKTDPTCQFILQTGQYIYDKSGNVTGTTTHYVAVNNEKTLRMDDGHVYYDESVSSYNLKAFNPKDADHYITIYSKASDYEANLIGNQYPNSPYGTYFTTPTAVHRFKINDKTAPEITSDIHLYDMSESGFTLSFHVQDNYSVGGVYAKVWTYGQTESDAKTIYGSVMNSTSGSGAINVCDDNARIRVNTSDFGDFTGDYYAICYVYDSAENTTAKDISSEKICLYEVIPDTGTYIVTKDQAAIHDAPYAKVNGLSTTVDHLALKAKVSVTGRYANDYENTWYQMSDGRWIWGEYVVKTTKWSECYEIMKEYGAKHVYYSAGQAIPAPLKAKLLAASLNATNTVKYISLQGDTVSYLTGGSASVSHTLYFNANGGCCSSGSKRIYEGGTIGWLPTPTRVGYRFDGWFTAAEGGTQVTSATSCGTGNMTLYAHWTRIILLQGSCGDNLTFILYADGEMIFSGNGAMTSHPWTKDYADRISEIQLPDGVTSICSSAFQACQYLGDFSSPSALVSIGEYAFYNCKNLKSVTIGNFVTKIGWRTFLNCSSLESVIIPDSVTSISDDAFKDCTALKALTLSKNLKTMGSNTFGNCASLTSIKIPKSLESCVDSSFGPFANCDNLKSVSFEDGTIMIASGLFSDCTGLESISIPDSVTTIDGYAFFGCKNLKVISIGSSVAKVGYRSFKGCTSLESVMIPDSITTISSYAFNDCTNLTDIFYPASQEKWEIISIAQNAIPEGVTVHYGYMSGNLNGDDSTDSADLAILARHVAKIEVITDADKLKLADVNGDTLVTAADLTALAQYIKAQQTT